MLKYVDTLVSFSEVPDEVSLCINFSNCPCNCKGCHSPYLRTDIGNKLTPGKLLELIIKNKGITCVCLMGGDTDIKYLNFLARGIKLKNLKVAWYTGKQDIPEELNTKDFDYIKVGPYIEERGGLDNPNTNQIMFKVDGNLLTDITYKFHRGNSIK